MIFGYDSDDFLSLNVGPLNKLFSLLLCDIVNDQEEGGEKPLKNESLTGKIYRIFSDFIYLPINYDWWDG